MKEQHKLTFNLDDGESAPLQERALWLASKLIAILIFRMLLIWSTPSSPTLIASRSTLPLLLLSSTCSFKEGVGERGSLVGEQVDCDLQDVVDLVKLA